MNELISKADVIDIVGEMNMIDKESMNKKNKLILNKVLESFGGNLSSLIQQELEKERIEMYRFIEDKIIKGINKSKRNQWKDIKKAKENILEINNRLEPVEKKTNFAYDKTMTLEFNGEAQKLKKYFDRKVFKTTGINSNTNADEYKLFFGKLTSIIRGVLKDTYNVSRYGLIPLDELENCYRIVDNWFPPHDYEAKFMREYMERENRNDLPCSLKQAYNGYLDKYEGVTSSSKQ